MYTTTVQETITGTGGIQKKSFFLYSKESRESRNPPFEQRSSNMYTLPSGNPVHLYLEGMNYAPGRSDLAATEVLP